ncbi:endolytic transglycosylase MltG [Candidatus Kuenenbacteria bacterium CG_4_10_14_3_um_filter_39_14]|uniref:Endolytic murein transglycosylase n=6 Tax=Candidatus Kueneniibacteriota TaxID=1752740 RepID=A0A2M7MH67_9BACT|nr:MAG: endolytic transglycosylase MltG [Candidatus Kuenenbacteria bacterium CG_4_10_14_3_um_filter_39_14]
MYNYYMQVYKPEKRQAKRSGRKIFGVFVILVIFAGFIMSIWFLFILLNPISIEHTQFTISQGQSVNVISQNLFEDGIIKNKFVFETYTYLKGIESKLKAGEYNLPNVINIKRLTEILVAGEIPQEWELTVIEGWTVKDIAWRLENMGKFQTKELFEATGVNQPNNKFNFDISSYDFFSDKPAMANLEGYMFPDTYRFFAYATIDDIVRKMLNNFDKKLTLQLRQDIQAQGKTIFDIITMASIIEREVMTDNDRAIVSGIFWKRFEAGVPLQADSTINYITGKKTPALSAEDLKINSFYNTYLYGDLPPGPISNPGLASIKAAIYPAASDYWYFLTDSQSNVHYGRDFEEHKANKEKYLN